VFSFSVTNGVKAGDMPGSGKPWKAAANEKKLPYVVELVVASDGLDVKLNRQIVQFHQSRHIQPRHGRTIVMRSGFIYRWCFDDLMVARAFVEQFGGKFCKVT
jgi:hypothetical protein